MSRPNAAAFLVAAGLMLLAVSAFASDVPAPAGARTASSAFPVPPPPPIKASSYILIDFDTGQVLAAKNADERLPMASLTKLMTAYIVFSAIQAGQLTLDTKVPISDAAWRTGGSRMFINPGSDISVLNLLKGMIVESGNDATVALAQKVGGTRAGFVQMMNEYAQRLGLHSTHYEDVDGLPAPGHYTTARDLATLTRDLIGNFPQYYFIFKIRKFTWDHITQRNRVSLLWTDPSVDGLKTGHTQAAGYCLIASALRHGMRLISVVLNAPSWNGRLDDTEALLSYGYDFFDTEKLASAGQPVLRPRVYESSVRYAAIGTPSNLYVTVPRAGAAALRTAALVTTNPLVAPIAAGTTVGELTVNDGGRVIEQTPLVTLESVPEGGLLTRAIDGVKLWFRK